MDRGLRDAQHAEEKSLISARQGESHCPVCELCGTFEGLKICAACKDVWYCCKDHQRTHWSQHKPACKSSQTPKPQNNTAGGQDAAAVGGATSAKADQPQQPKTNSVSKSAPGKVSSPQLARPQPGGHAQGDASSTGTIVPTGGEEEEGALGGGRVAVVSEKGESDSAPTQTAAAPSPCTQGCNSKQPSADSTLTNLTPPTQLDMTQCKTPCGTECHSKVPIQAAIIDKPISKSAKRRARKASLASSSSSTGSASSSSLTSSHASNGNLVSRNTSSNSLASSNSASSLPGSDGDLQAAGLTQTMPEPNSSTKDLADYVVKYLTEYGICVVDKFLGETLGNSIHDEVVGLHDKGIFQEGQLISPHGPKQKIRGDQIMWVERGEPDKDQISFLVGRLDILMMACNERFRRNEVGGRTKAMVACYPGSGSYYLRHVDNPNEDGRLITCIYYLNKGWDAKRDGGVLRIFPERIKNTWVADIEPQFDRLLFFWSDRRNPHEVQAAYKQRFAITVWYFDKSERQQALSRHQSGDSKPGNARTMSTTLVSATSKQDAPSNQE